MKPDLKNIKRNEIYLADLGHRDGSEQGGVRPVLIIQNNVGNFYAPTVIVASITDAKAAHIPTHVYMKAGNGNLIKDSVIMLEQIRTIDKQKLIRLKGVLSDVDAAKVDAALSISLAMRG